MVKSTYHFNAHFIHNASLSAKSQDNIKPSIECLNPFLFAGKTENKKKYSYEHNNKKNLLSIKIMHIAHK